MIYCVGLRLVGKKKEVQKMKKNILESVISAIILAFIMFLVSYFLNSYFAEKVVVRVSDPIRINGIGFQTSVDVLNFKDNYIEKLRIKLPVDIKLENILVNEPLQINKIDPNIGSGLGTIFEVERIDKNQKIRLIFLSSAIFDEHEIIIQNRKDKIQIEFFDQVKSPIENQILTLILSSLIYVLVIGIFTYYSDKKTNQTFALLRENNKSITQQQEMSSEQLTQTKEQIALLNIRIEKTDLELDRIKNNYRKKSILYSAKLRDYSKEVDFWRDTIRKILYQFSNGKIDSEALVKSITSTLKTYKTYDEDEENFEEIKILASILKEDN